MTSAKWHGLSPVALIDLLACKLYSIPMYVKIKCRRLRHQYLRENKSNSKNTKNIMSTAPTISSIFCFLVLK